MVDVSPESRPPRRALVRGCARLQSGRFGVSIQSLIGEREGARIGASLFGTSLAAGLALLGVTLSWGSPDAVAASCVFLAAVGLSYVSSRRAGSAWIASALIPSTVLGAAAWVIVRGDGIHDLGILLLPMAVIFGGLLLGKRAALAFALLGSALASGVVYAELRGWIISPYTGWTEPDDAVIVCVVLGLAGALVWVVMASLTRSVADTRASEARWRSLVENLPDTVLNVRVDGRIVLASAGDHESWTHVQQAVAAADRDLLEEALSCVFEQARPATCELRGAKEDIWYSVRIAPIEADGAVVAATVILTDSTARRRADSERRRLEEQLRQSQKMEALGQLAGGVAHDFNNVLTVIGGNAEALVQQVDESAKPLLAEILHGRDRAEALTRQLLAFGRRQVLEPATQPLNDVVEGVHTMLGRLVGEKAHLEIRLGQAGCVRVDRSQLEQVIVNLVVNARDAVGHGGRVEVRTDSVAFDAPAEYRGTRVPAGRWSVLVVEDDGCGMDAETRREIFQPFFTTKPVGEGTGLGLSTVYGIVSQSDGVIGVESAPGRGTSVWVFLPDCGDDT